MILLQAWVLPVMGLFTGFCIEIKSHYVGENGCLDYQFSDVSAYDGSANRKTM